MLVLIYKRQQTLHIQTLIGQIYKLLYNLAGYLRVRLDLSFFFFGPGYTSTPSRLSAFPTAGVTPSCLSLPLVSVGGAREVSVPRYGWSGFDATQGAGARARVVAFVSG